VLVAFSDARSVITPPGPPTRASLRPMPARAKQSVQESCVHEQLAAVDHGVSVPKTWFFVVPGVGFEPTLPCGKGGLSRPGAVQLVLWIPFAQLRCGAPVRRVR
jgi:hypothetical protein